MTSTCLPGEESLTVEFKSDRNCLSDEELVGAVTCLANTEGGTLYIGVEDDGTPSGLHAKHRSRSTGLPAMIANRTVPALVVTVELLGVDGHEIACIAVPKSHRIIATTGGLAQRRRLDTRGKPECIPLLPHEIPTRLSDLGALDTSRQPVPATTLDDLDPVERGRVRQFVERYGGDRSLLALSDDELDAALGLVVRDGGTRVPSLAGVLLLGREAALRQFVPTHEVAFQVLEGEAVRTNEFTRAPLLRVFEWLETTFTPLNPEQELQVGLFRVPVPRVDRHAFREAIANALTHRDYTRLGAIHVRLGSDDLTVSNPGGFVEGVTAENLLTTEPRPRNPVLADALKRIGLVERTGCGVDLIYRGLLRYGRPRPSYAQSTATSVVLKLSASEANLAFLALVLDAEERRGNALPIDSLIALSCLREQRRLSTDELAMVIQKDRAAAKRTFEALVESGLAEPHGNSKARTYTLAATVYASLGQQSEYARQAGFDRIQQEQMILSLAGQQGELARSDVMSLCRVSEDQATRLLQRLVDQGKLIPQGTRRWRRYHLPKTS